MRNQLDGLRDSRGNAQRGGVMQVPAILSAEEWEKLASVQQDALIASSYEDRATREPVATPPVPTPDPHLESERLYQQELKGRINTLKDFRDATKREVARASQVTR